MSDTNLVYQVFKNYMHTVRTVVGSELFKHAYVVDKRTNKEFDALDDGRLACAHVVSCILTMHGLLDKPHATVETTLKKMQEHGWRKAKAPIPGAIVVWPSKEEHGHIGFYMGADECISNSTEKRVPVVHQLTMADGRVPEAFFVHDALPTRVIH